MKQSTLLGLVLALLLSSAGCSRGNSPGNKEEREPDMGPDVERVDSPAGLYRASIELANALADVLAEIKDRDAAKRAVPKLRILTRKAKSLDEKSQELSRNNLQSAQQLPNAKDKEDFEKAQRRAEVEWKRIQAKPELWKIIREMDLKGSLP